MAPSPWDSLNLPPVWAPTPCTFQWARIDGVAGGMAVHQHVLIIDGASGRQGFALTDEQVRELAKTCTEQVSGLIVAPALPLRDTNGGSS